MGVVKISNNCIVKKTQKKLKPQQSANTLFHAKKELDWLIDDIKNGYFSPRYVNENIEYLNVRYKYLSIPMVCFCDVFLGKLSKHMKVYGDYVIGMKKSWGEMKKLQKILYLSQDSTLDEIVKNRFSLALSTGDVSDGEKDIILKLLKFIKPILGNQDGKDIYYPDDAEWRYVPEFSDDELPELISFEIKPNFQLEKYNKVLASEISKYKLYFEEEDIKYIIVPNKTSFNKIVKVLQKEGKEKLFSKLIIWKDIKEDL